MHPSSIPAVPVTALTPGALLLDVREDDEWAAGHAPDAVHVPLHDVPARLAELPTDRPVDVVCHFGGRSAQATAFLLQRGVDARNVDGGMDAWERAGLPVVTDDGGPGRVL
ncbi:MAG: rhodanese-like protein [Frankiales bacterium]|nr:rhodanese-like protein [Frankiales bacterium]